MALDSGCVADVDCLADVELSEGETEDLSTESIIDDGAMEGRLGKGGHAQGKKNGMHAAEPKSRGTYKKSKKGIKWCRRCRKWLPIEKYPAGSADCDVDKRATQNLEAAARAQHQLAWWKETRADPEKLASVVANYHRRCPDMPDKKRRETFPIMQLIQETRQESAVLIDGVYEMMDLRTYWHHMAKPKNGSIEVSDSIIKFRELCEHPNAILDNFGPSEKYLRRYALTVKYLITIRDAKIESRGIRPSEAELKKSNPRGCGKVAEPSDPRS